MEPQTLREVILSNELQKVRFQVIYDKVYIHIKRIQIISHLDVPENEWRPLIENLSLTFKLKGPNTHTVKIPITFVTLASSFNSRPEFEVDISLPDSLEKISRYTGGKWDNIEVSIDSKKALEYEVKVFFESDMIQG